MSRQTQQDDRWLAGYRRIAVIVLLMVIVTTLVRSYQINREEAQQLSLTLLGEQFAERAQRLHGIWLNERRPGTLHSAGHGWQFDERGWPLGLLPPQSPSENCRQLWLALVGETEGSMPPLQFLARPDGSGCEIGWDGYWLVYLFSDGRVMKKP
ncbi:hypothetical protein K3H47_06630 [Aeromonas veronii]|uniref:MSHA biogenesis protein MshF n=1 Tax=Aeromonas veronii AMC34 TaxID=1073383 RepID=K1J5V4_AERVE|nr:hypothetical protein [Aeromonas veronii]EKB21673.1 hypothetical protein HMPREF1168_01225 [Aeromonas veronii AMC34]MCF5763629.1 hypothetical protein [Aeromonas veronii]